MRNWDEMIERQRQRNIAKNMSADKLITRWGRGYDHAHAGEEGYISLSKRWEDIYKRARDYYNNEAHKGFYDTYSGTRTKQGYVSDTGRWYSELEGLRDTANEGVDELLAELDQYSDYYNEDAVKYVRGLITERQNAYNDAMKDAGEFRDTMSQWKTEDDYNYTMSKNDAIKAYESGDYDAAEQILKGCADKLFSKYGDDHFGLINSEEYKELLGFEELVSAGRANREQEAADKAQRAEYAAYDVNAGQAEIDRLKEFSARAQAINDELNQVRSAINSAKARGQNVDSLLARERALNVQLYQLSEEYRGNGSSAENSFIRNDGASGKGLPSGMGLNVGNSVVEMGGLVDFDALLKAKEQEKDSWFSASALWDDGYQPFDVIKTIGATAQDIGEAVGSGLIGIGETALDGLMWLGAAMNQGTMSQAAQDEMIYNAAKSLVTGEKVENGVDTLSRYQAYQDQVEQGAEDFIKQDLYDEEAISHAIFSEHNPISYDHVFNRDSEADSVSGSKLDSIAQSGGQMLGTAALQAVGVPWYVTTFATSFGSEAENALNNGASFSEAGLSATISASAEVLTEKIGGINFKGQTLSDLAVKKFSSVCANKIAQFAFDAGLDIAGEGLEEVLSGYASAVGQKLTYMSDEELNELFSSEDALDAFIGGAIMGGVSSVGDAVKMFKNKDTTSIELGTAASRVVRTDADITLGTKIADFISSVINMQDRSKISKRKLNLGGITKAHQTTVDSVMKTVDSDFSSEGYELWMDGTSAEHIVKRHGEKGEADNSMATREAQELIALTVNDPDAAILIKDEAGNLKLSNRYFNADGSKAPQIRLERVLDDGTVYVSECIPDSVNKRIYITSAYIKKGSTDQLLNMDSEGSPQPTPEASFDGSATNSSISQDSGNVNSKISTDLSRYAELAGMGENGVQMMQEVYDGKMSPEKFFEAYNAIYAAGKRGGDVRNRYVSLLGESVAAMARNAGQMDALKGGKSATAYKAGERAAKAQSTEISPEVLQNGAESGTINTNGKEAQNEQGLHLRQGGERNDGTNTGGQVSAVEGRAGEAEEQGSGSTQEARTARIGAYVQVEGLEKVSTRSIGVSSGTDKASVVVIPESEYDDGMRQIIKDQAEQGRNVVFVSGSLEIIENGEAVEARGLISEDGKTMWIQADSDVSAEQISLHEEYHAKVKSDPSLLNRMKKKIKKKYKGKLGVLTKMYAALYFTDGNGKVTVSADYIFEEICADAYAGIDVLESFDAAEIRATDFQETIREGAKGIESTRAPPSSSEVKASRATQDIYTATSDFAREVVKEDRSAFTSQLSSKTKGIKHGETRVVAIYAPRNIYLFIADGYMTGNIGKTLSSSADIKQVAIARKDAFNEINSDTEIADLWSQPISIAGRRSGGDISVHAQRRSANARNDILPADTSERDIRGNNEQSGRNNYSVEEIDAILKPLKEMYGVDDSGIKASHTSKSAEEIAKAYLDAVPKRMILANALESVVSSEEDKKKLRLYKHKIKELDAMETELSEANARIRELSFATGPRDKVTLTELKKRKTELESRISRYDSSLIRLEASEPIQKVLRLTKKQAVAKVKASRATQDIYTATSDFARDVIKEDRSAFTSHLLSQTRGMKPSDVKGIQIFGAKRIYFFLATGEMTGKVYKSVSNKRLNLYKKICEEFFNGIEQSGEGPALWAEFDSLKEGGDISDTSLSGYGRTTDGNDTISEKSSQSNSARSDERSGGYTYSAREIDAILKPLKEMYGVDDSGIKASRTSKSAEEIAKAYLDAVPKRMILANALESVVSSEEDKKKLRLYKYKIKELDAMETELSEVNANIRELSFAPGPRDKVTLAELKKRKTELESRISRYDSSIIRLEASEPLQKVLRLTKKQAVAKVKAEAKVKLDAQREKAREALDKQAKRYQESRRKSTEGRHKTEMRHKIQRVVAELDKLLRHGNKKSNVKIGLQDAVAAALEAFDINAEKVERYNKDMARLDAKIAAATDSLEIEALTALREKKQRNSERLADKLQAMKKAYEDIHNGRDGENYPGYYKAEAEVIENRIAEVIEKVGNTPIGEMSLDQLDAVYDMYRMVLTTVQNANKVFRDGKLADLTSDATDMTSELQKIKKLPEERLKAGENVRGFVWNELTPYYAFKRVGSGTLMSYYDELVRGQDVYARDVDEARQFALDTRKKHGYGKWKLDEVHSFRDKDGRKFDLTLKHMMSIYAYSKREQALDHMENGGFFFNNKETFRKKAGVLEFIASNESGYKVDASVFAKIKGSLTAEQIAYVDEMQSYLTKMGEKGNEVTRVMWGIDIFKEKVYFPLKSKEDFIYQANTPAETSSLKNDGMTKETKPHASNPIVLEAFDEVWANHVEKMSKYHGFVIPIDNLNKLINYGTWMESKKIASNMSDAERYSILKDKVIKDIPKVKTFKLDTEKGISTWSDIDKLTGKEKRIVIQKIATEFAAFKGYENKDVEIAFDFSNSNFKESYGKQKRHFQSFAKLFSVFDEVIENAVGIEVHNRNAAGYKPDPSLKNVYVLMSAFEDGDNIIPVKLEVKEFSDKQNTLYVAVTMEEIKKAEVSTERTSIEEVAYSARSANISISRIFEKINTSDQNFLKYVPNGFLNDQQILAKKQALEKDGVKYSPSSNSDWNGSEMGSHSISTMLEARFGSGANDYLTTFIKDLNGAKAQSGGFIGGISNLFTKFKKTAVGASLSVVVQQPTAIIRATSEIDAKYFAHLPKIESLNKKWEQIQKYAPIAIIKDIGGFDAGSGRSIAEWINADTRRGVKRALNKIDDVSMYGAALGDRVGWGAIWTAVGREVQAKQHLKYGTEEFWQACGKRFTEVIVKTQVYDSTLSRSGFMRGKDSVMKMATSFMGEPTLSINMIADSILQVKRGEIKKRQVIRTVAAVYTATVAASIIKSFIYALRDDDEDESLAEKYMQALGGTILNDINPLSMLPVTRDVVSILEGWDVGRSDMEIVQDLYNAITALDSEEKTTWRKIEDLAGAMGALAGVPAKNFLRTAREIYNLVNDMFDGIEGGDLGGAFFEGVTGKDKSKSQTLYEALIDGDPERIAVLRKGYDDDKEYYEAVRKALREYDPRIREAACSYIIYDVGRKDELYYKILAEGNFSGEVIDAALESEMDSYYRKCKDVAEAKTDGNYKKYEKLLGELLEQYGGYLGVGKIAEDIEAESASIAEAEEKPKEKFCHNNAYDASLYFDSGNEQTALAILDELMENKIEYYFELARYEATTKDKDFDEWDAMENAEWDARESLRGSMTDYWKEDYQEAYASGNTDEMTRIRNILESSGLYIYKNKNRTIDNVLEEWCEKLSEK